MEKKELHMIELLVGRGDIVVESFEMKAMNTIFYIEISNSTISDWKRSITALLQYFETEFSRFKTHNELWRFNQLQRNSTVVVSPVFYDLLKRADEYYQITDGRFSPYMLSELVAHGYNQSFPFKASNYSYVPTNYQNESQPLTFHGDCTITKNTHQKIDLGGIAKGYAVDAVGKWLNKYAHSRFGMVDGGGDIALWSNGEKTWTIAVMDPFNEEKEIGSLGIQNGGIATSNIVYRSWLQDGIKKHHLFDGRTGLPVEPHIVQSTVVTKDCLDAEIGAKICFMEDVTIVKSVLINISNKFQFVLVKPNGEVIKGGAQ